MTPDTDTTFTDTTLMSAPTGVPIEPTGTPVVGSLCTGIGGLDLALAALWPGAVWAWVADHDPDAHRVLTKRFPTTPNLGDFTHLDPTRLPAVDVLGAGYPCQPFSTAGRRKGDADDRHLWPTIAATVRVLRPRTVVLENVAGHLSLGFGQVLFDLAALGYLGSWLRLAAADIGAPHHRHRVFLHATLPTTAAHPEGQRGTPHRDPVQPPHDPAGAQWAGDPGGNRAHPRRRGRFPWGRFTPAITHWEHLTGRLCPYPLDPASRGGEVLAAEFVEWLMGFPSGWVTGVPGVTNRAALRLLGNAVVPAQATTALHALLTTHHHRVAVPTHHRRAA